MVVVDVVVGAGVVVVVVKTLRVGVVRYVMPGFSFVSILFLLKLFTIFGELSLEYNTEVWLGFCGKKIFEKCFNFLGDK